MLGGLEEKGEKFNIDSGSGSGMTEQHKIG
jgi:hypothetical protein